MKPFCLFLGLSLLTMSAVKAQTTTVTVDANNVMNSANTSLNIVTPVGQSFFVGRQAGSGYTNLLGVFRAVTDNPNGSENWFYEGVRNGTQTFAIRADGNMRLGTGPQGYYGGYSTLSIGNAAGGTVDFWTGNSLTGLVYGSSSGLNLSAQVGSIHLGAGNQEVMTISSNGSTYLNNGNLFFAHGSSWLSEDQSGAIELGSSTATSSLPYIDMHYGGQPSFQDYNVRLMNNGNNQLQFQTASNGTVMTIKGGSVGIGTAKPDQALTVNGTIHATKVLVEASVPTPDYVFEKDYKLRSLKELEEYIKAHKHLPEVASAKEMKEKGVDVNEMNMKLLQKVEEMTLYMINLKKELSTQKQSNENLRKQLSKLSSRIK